MIILTTQRQIREVPVVARNLLSSSRASDFIHILVTENQPLINQ